MHSCAGNWWEAGTRKKSTQGQGVGEKEDAQDGNESELLSAVGRLDVDVYQTGTSIVIYAPIYGADIAVHSLKLL